MHQIKPNVVIPMHYRDDKAGFGFDVISTVDEFTECMDPVLTLKESSISTDQMPNAHVVVLVPRDKAHEN